jgi:prephenate dehydratase
VGPAAPLRVGYQGEPGAYSDLAVHDYFGPSGEGVPFRTFPDVLSALRQGQVDRAMIPVENAIAGPVRVALDALAEVGDALAVLTEHRLTIVLCLLGVPGSTLAAVRTVRSHPVALAQCRIFLARHPWLDAVGHDDTAGAAREVAERGDRTIGAIASAMAAERYGLEVLAREVQDLPINRTRFQVLQRANDHGASGNP